MKRSTFFICAVCLVLAFSSYAVANLEHNIAAPEYYINDAGACVQLQTATHCVPGEPDCIKQVAGQTSTKLIYDARLASGQCVNPLHCPDFE